MRKFAFSFITILIAISSPASAHNVVAYTNGPPLSFSNGTNGSLDGGYDISTLFPYDSFQISTQTNISGFSFAGWNRGTITSTTYKIFNQSGFIKLGNVSLSAGPVLGVQDGYNLRVYTATDTGTVSNIALSAGNYWFGLTNAFDANNPTNYSYWDVNNGPSSGYNNQFGQDHTHSNTFTLYAESVPEPMTWLMIFAGIFGVGAAMRLHRKKTADWRLQS